MHRAGTSFSREASSGPVSILPAWLGVLPRGRPASCLARHSSRLARSHPGGKRRLGILYSPGLLSAGSIVAGWWVLVSVGRRAGRAVGRAVAPTPRPRAGATKDEHRHGDYTRHPSEGAAGFEAG